MGHLKWGPYTDWSHPTYECLTGPPSARRPRPTPHTGRVHFDGCRRRAACGCEQVYYSAFYNRNHGWKYARDGILRCDWHWRQFLKRIHGR